MSDEISAPTAPEWFRHPNALVESSHIGRGTRVWAFAHVLPGAVIGADCNICDHVFIENDVRLGDRVTVKCGVQIWDGIELEDDVFVGPNATFTNDRFPRSRQWLEAHPRTRVRAGASIGANATILPGINIGRRAMIGAGAVVLHDVPPNAVVVGNPGRIVGYVDAPPDVPQGTATAAPAADADGSCRVPGVVIVRLRTAADLRGSLVAAQVDDQIPFAPRRVFLVHGVPSRSVRGEHAHRSLHQFLVCVRGECSVVVDDGSVRQEIRLHSPDRGVHLPPMVWGIQYKFSPDAVLMVLASDVYDPADYIRDYDEFLRLKSEAGDRSA